MANPPAKPNQWHPVPYPAGPDADFRRERDALHIQFVGEVWRGLNILEKELRRLDWAGAMESLALLKLSAMAMDEQLR